MSPVRRRLASSALALSISGILGTAGAQEFSGFVVFGDSLSDAGTLASQFPPGGGKFTTNPGPVWAEVVAQRYGLDGAPANAGGSNYATGGSRVSQLPGVPPYGPTAAATPLVQQVNAFLGSHAADRDALYALWAGNNDIFVQGSAVLMGQISATQAVAALQTAALELVQQVGRLQANGARYILVWNLPDIGQTPDARGAGPLASAAATQLSGLYNSALTAGLQALGGNAVTLNAWGLLNEVLASPGTYGFTNATSIACTSIAPDGMVRSPYCTPSTLVSPDAPQTYVFADGVHPTTGTHAIMADYVASVLEAPGKIGLLAEAPIQGWDALMRVYESRSLAGARAVGSFELFAGGDFGRADIDGSGRGPGMENRLYSFGVGGDMMVAPNMVAGVGVGFTRSDADFGRDSGGFRMDEVSAVGYVGAWTDAGWVVVAAGAGDLDYSEVQRDIDLGPARRTERGSTAGTHVVALAQGGWTFTEGVLRHGPVGGLTYHNVRVDGYSEQGAASTAMVFSQQQRTALVGSLGWEVSTRSTLRGTPILPWVRLSYEHDFLNRDREVRAGLVTTAGTIALPVQTVDDGRGVLKAGISAQFAPKVTGYLNATTDFGRDGRAYGLGLGLLMGI